MRELKEMVGVLYNICAAHKACLTDEAAHLNFNWKVWCILICNSALILVLIRLKSRLKYKINKINIEGLYNIPGNIQYSDSDIE